VNGKRLQFGERERKQQAEVNIFHKVASSSITSHVPYSTGNWVYSEYQYQDMRVTLDVGCHTVISGPQ
jgi:hypothetical protein